MARTVGIGIQSFSDVIEGNYFYLDKTSFIKEWWESGDSVTLITRPRRFGKTLNLNMIETFFSVNYADRGDLLGDTDREYFQRINVDMNDVDAAMALHKLSKYLYTYYGKKVIILLDEYDTPMQEAYVGGYWEELTAFTRSLFNATFKTNPWLARGIMTGITQVSKESIFSDLNNLKVVTTTSDEYAASFGFAEEEVFDALEVYGLGAEKEKVKGWYDGFVFGEYRDIYNPWSVLNFLATAKYNTYWANTSSNKLVAKLIQEGSGDLKSSFEILLKGEKIYTPIDEQIVYSQLDEDEAAIWSLLVASGYLKVLSYDREELLEEGEDVQYELTSNRESGFGRYDVILSPKNPNHPAYILEFKVHDPEDEKSLQDNVQSALAQIERKLSIKRMEKH